eukprot:SAG22_NODE_15117_length_356_cov_1.171206_1_plen_34_part_10
MGYPKKCESAYAPEEVAAFCRINAFKYIWRSTAH